MRPTATVTVRAGDLLGAGGGSEAANWDIGVFVDNRAVCAFDLLAEPHRGAFSALIGTRATNGPVPGTPCEVEPGGL
jgi:hypothetical protein